MATDGKPIPSVWARPRKQREQPALTRERIVAEAVRLLDEEGLEALSMRSLGTRLNAGATSLYRHVANKDELIELVVDEVYGELPVPALDDPAGWRAAVVRAAGELRTMALRHSWVASVLGQVGLAELGPNVSRVSDGMLSLFTAAGFAPEDADRSMKTVLSFVIGTVTSEAAWLSLVARSGMGERELVVSLRGEDTGRDPGRVREENFAFGLERVLDGLEVHLSRKG
ncbi:TetR/AcrR family transcriptional regulator [Actinomadura kijaniata]|uniref:AcrR family transcriptional regulator n=1 Tax=Actinomadura namibiensis TaxID=182080 RepID=A0A7W3QPE9_ACTNM|nr:TetR/AcrR family transcriptional regulator [Actinomadura namibiensis]MBA8954595.1 AcrR family transcriptional regulator [Actinomadura namibiensis]